jgi:hypothetical protein
VRPQSAKAKGRNAQKQIRDELLRFAPHLTENDIRSTSMGASGVDILMSTAALNTYPFAIEVKCQEALNIWAAMQQAEDNKSEGLTPILCFKRNRSEMYVSLKFTDFMRLLGHESKA